MVRHEDGTVEGIQKICRHCGSPLELVTLNVSFAWGYGDRGGVCVGYSLRCMTCNPSEAYEWRDKMGFWSKYIKGTSSDRDAIEEALEFLKMKVQKFPHMRTLTKAELQGPMDPVTTRVVRPPESTQERVLQRVERRNRKPLCTSCGKKIPPERVGLTCSTECHEIFVAHLEKLYGEFKKVIDFETGIVYKVPARYIIENGLKQQELKPVRLAQQ